MVRRHHFGLYLEKDVEYCHFLRVYVGCLCKCAGTSAAMPTMAADMAGCVSLVCLMCVPHGTRLVAQPNYE